MAGIKIGNLSRKVMKELEGYGIAAAVEVEKVVDEVAKDAAQTLRNTSPKLTGDYAGAWTYSQGDKTKTRKSKIVHVEKPEYSLSHLLEKGHSTPSLRAIYHTLPGLVKISPVTFFILHFSVPRPSESFGCGGTAAQR